MKPENISQDPPLLKEKLQLYQNKCLHKFICLSSMWHCKAIHSTKPGAKATMAQALASATGEPFVSANKCTVVVTYTCTFESMAL